MIRPAELSDVRHICETMWERGAIELTYLRISPEDWLDGWKCRINRGDAVAIDSHAILGWDWEDESTCATAFQASRSFEEPGIGRSVTRELRLAIPSLAKASGAKLVNTYSLCGVPEAEKWFRLLGLLEDTNYKGPRCGPFQLRRFFRSV